MTPFSSVAMLEKLALLKIAFCKAPAFSRASSRRISVTILMAGGSPWKTGGIFIIVLRVALFAQKLLKTSRYFGQNDRFGKKGKSSDPPTTRLDFFFRDGRRQKYNRHVFQFGTRLKTGGQFAAVQTRHHH